MFARSILFFFLLYSGLSNASSTIHFTDEEQHYIENNPTLKVNTEERWPPYNFVEYGEIKGYSNDLIRLLASKIGINVKFKTGVSWLQSLEDIKNNKIDIISNLRKTDTRKHYLQFSDQAISNTHDAILFKNIHTGSTLTDYFNDRVIAVVEGYSYQEILAEHYPKTKILLTSDTLESIELVLNGQADAAIGASSVFNYYIGKYFFSTIEVQSLLSEKHFKKTPNYLGINQEKPILKRIIDKGLASISLEEIHQLEKKWLSQKMKKPKVHQLPFSQSEKNYLLKKQNITFCIYPNWMPLSGIDRHGATGITGDFLKLIESKINVPFIMVHTSGWQDALDKVNARQCDIIAPIESNAHRSSTLNFSRSLMKSDIVIATKAERRFISNFSTLTKVKIGIINGYSIPTINASFHPSVQFVLVDSLDEGLKSVQTGELFGVVDSLEVISYKLQRHFPSLIINGKLGKSHWSLRIGSRKDEPELKNIIEKAIDNISTSEQETIMNTWLSVRYTSPHNLQLFKGIILFTVLIVIFLLYRQKILKQYNQKLEVLSTIDSLTQLYNRRVIDSHLEKQIALSINKSTPLSIIIGDIDYFKKINDNLGHLIGDTVITDIAACLLNNVRKSDMIGRWGGEEFLIVCANTDIEKAHELANHLRKKIADLPVINNQSISMSFGVAHFKHDFSCEELLIKADAALYSAKEKGRNCVVSANLSSLQPTY